MDGPDTAPPTVMDGTGRLYHSQVKQIGVRPGNLGKLVRFLSIMYSGSKERHKPPYQVTRAHTYFRRSFSDGWGKRGDFQTTGGEHEKVDNYYIDRQHVMINISLGKTGVKK